MVNSVEQLGQLRPYLLFLARISWDQRLQPKLDPSDLVQQTLLQAHAKIDQYQGKTQAEFAAWLRQILANVLAEQQRHFGRAKRDLARERSVHDMLEESSRRLSGLAGAEISPSEYAEFSDRAVRIATAVESLPSAQRDAIVLHYWQGHSIPEVAKAMNRSSSAVGGLVHRGLRKLRVELAEFA